MDQPLQWARLGLIFVIICSGLDASSTEGLKLCRCFRNSSNEAGKRITAVITNRFLMWKTVLYRSFRPLAAEITIPPPELCMKITSCLMAAAFNPQPENKKHFSDTLLAPTDKSFTFLKALSSNQQMKGDISKACTDLWPLRKSTCFMWRN